VAGVAIAPAVQVKVADAFGNGVAGASVSLALVGTGALSGSAPVASDAGGIARFNALSVNLVGGKQLTASSTGLPNAASGTFNVTAAAAVAQQWAQQPTDVVGGGGIAPAVQVKVVDGFGNGVAGASVTLALVGTGTLTGGGASATGASGVVTFSTLRVDRSGGKQLTAASGALAALTSVPFTV